MSNKQLPTNIGSMLLNSNENESLFQVLGRGCVTLATGVVQLYLAEVPDRARWSKRCCGVACFVKDNPKRSYFIRVYDIKGQQVWEQELYNQFHYKTPRQYFHTFEAHNGMAGLNFASEDEANKFKKAVEKKLQERLERRREMKRQRTQHGQVNKLPESRQASAVCSGDTTCRHVSHVGWDPNKGFDMNNLDQDMQHLFQSVGISANDDLSKETVDFIYDFVEKHGGIEALRQEMQQRPVAPPGISRVLSGTWSGTSHTVQADIQSGTSRTVQADIQSETSRTVQADSQSGTSRTVQADSQSGTSRTVQAHIQSGTSHSAGKLQKEKNRVEGQTRGLCHMQNQMKEQQRATDQYQAQVKALIEDKVKILETRLQNLDIEMTQLRTLQQTHQRQCQAAHTQLEANQRQCQVQNEVYYHLTSSIAADTQNSRQHTAAEMCTLRGQYCTLSQQMQALQGRQLARLSLPDEGNYLEIANQSEAGSTSALSSDEN